MSRCDCCQPQEGAAIDALRGNLTAEDLAADGAAAVAEGIALGFGTQVYHYFEGDRRDEKSGLPLWKIIYIDQAVGSRVLCLTEEAITASVAGASSSVRPHYGDGAYCTLHADYVNVCEVVRYAHGIDPVICRYRAVLAIDEPDRFRKFAATGGVTRSIPRTSCLKRLELVRIGVATGEARLLRIEAYIDGCWRRVPPPWEG